MKGCDQLGGIKAILKLKLPNHIMFALNSWESFRVVLVILIFLEMFVERSSYANVFILNLRLMRGTTKHTCYETTWNKHYGMGSMVRI